MVGWYKIVEQISSIVSERLQFKLAYTINVDCVCVWHIIHVSYSSYGFVGSLVSCVPLDIGYLITFSVGSSVQCSVLGRLQVKVIY